MDPPGEAGPLPHYTPSSQAKVRARGSRSQQWYAEGRAQLIRRKVRTQSAWNLHLAFRGGTGRVPAETFFLRYGRDA